MKTARKPTGEVGSVPLPQSPRHRLLSDPLVRARLGSGPIHGLTLPQVLAALSRGEDLDFIALRPHQQPAWHAFVVSLAVLAMEASDAKMPATDADTWARWLRGLTRHFPGDEPWCLVVPDLQLPAFLQAPCPPGREGDFSTNPKHWLKSAQELDRLVTAKNHDEKSGKVTGDESLGLDAWLYALVSLQGFTGGLGRGNYGSARMNGAFGSRSQFRLVFDEGAGSEFLRETGVLHSCFESLLDEASQAGIGTVDPMPLAWLSTWDGSSASLSRMHPMGLEVCRRVRLMPSDDGIACATAGSEGMRFDAKDRRGMVHDPWTPVVMDDEGPKALTATAETLHYRHLAPLMFDGKRYRLPVLARPTQAELKRHGGAFLQVRVLVGGGGKTDGWQQRSVWVTSIGLRRLATGDDQAALRAQQFVEIASQMQGKSLRPAMLQFVDGSEQPNYKNPDAGRAVEPWVDRFQRAVDEVFFPALFESLATHPLDEPAQAAWAAQLRDLATGILHDAMTSLPTRDPSRQFARARAVGLFHGALRKHFPAASPPRASLPEPVPGQATQEEPADV